MLTVNLSPVKAAAARILATKTLREENTVTDSSAKNMKKITE